MEKTYAVFGKSGKIFESKDVGKVVELFQSLPPGKRKSVLVAVRGNFWRAISIRRHICQQR